MIENFLKDVGEFLVEKIREEILIKRERYTKSPRMPKRPPRYNFSSNYTQGSLYNSVSYTIQDGEIFVLMNDYGVDYVFGTGSKPRKPLPKKVVEGELKLWVINKMKIPAAKAKGVAYAVSKNLSKVGYSGYALFQDDFTNDTYDYVNNLMDRPEYMDAILREELGDIFDRINLIGRETYTIAIGL
jgi:hypothetical protein